MIRYIYVCVCELIFKQKIFKSGKNSKMLISLEDGLCIDSLYIFEIFHNKMFKKENTKQQVGKIMYANLILSNCG